LNEWARKHLALIGYLILAVGIGIGFYFLNQSRVALCALHEDLNDRILSQQQSIDNGVKFLCPPVVRAKLHCHPPRAGGFGLTKSELEVSVKTQIAAQRRSLENSRRTKDALEVVWCGNEKASL